MLLEWIYGLVGGLMIGTAGAIYLLINGRIMGASGILGGILDRTDHQDIKQRYAFIAGVLLFPAIYSLFTDINPTQATTNIPLLIVAGLLVGLGTRIGGGCTSGHGVCGMSRLSVRSVVATLIYIAAGIIAFAVLQILRGSG
ncbi:MAG: YeeE/YedE family protein [Pseudomonadota bacterium]